MISKNYNIWRFKNVKNEQDFEFLAGMLLLQRVNGSSSFYKGPQTLHVLGSLQKLLPPLTFRSNVPLSSHFHQDKPNQCPSTFQPKVSYWKYLPIFHHVYLWRVLHDINVSPITYLQSSQVVEWLELFRLRSGP